MTTSAVATSEVVFQLRQLLSGLASADNATREAHENIFEQAWVPQPEPLILGLINIASSDSEANIRSFASILLRRVVGKLTVPGSGGGKAVRLWNQTSPTAQSQGRQILLEAWKREAVHEVRNKLGDAIAEISRIINQHEEWPQLLEMLWTVSANHPAPLISSALRILAAVPECVDNQKAEIVANYLVQFFSHQDVSVRLACVKALLAIITSCGDDKKLAYGKILVSLPDFLGALLQAGGDAEETLVESMQCIVEMVDDCPKLFRGIVPRLVPVLVAIADTPKDTLEEETKSAALELITTLTEAMPATFRKQSGLISTTVTLLLKTTSSYLESDDSGEWYRATPEDENEEEALSLAAEQSLDRISIALEGKALLPIIMQSIPGMLSSSNWMHRYAALRAIANMAEGCADLLADRLGDLLSLIWPAFNDAHARVQYAACHALGQLCTDFAGPLQERFAQQCLASLVGVLVSSSQPRVQCHAAAALINFAEGVDSAIVAPFLDGLLERLISLLGSNVVYLQEQVIATMASFSSAAGTAFQKFAPQVVPLLMNCLTSNLEKSYRQLQCRALEAVTMIAVAVGKEDFAPYTPALLDHMVKLQKSELDDDDLISDYLTPAWVRMCQVLGPTFASFVPLVLPRLLEEAAAEPDIAVIDAADPGAEDEYDPAEWTFSSIRGRRLGIHTATLDNKCAAVENLAIYIATLQTSFAPYVEQTFATVLPLIHFSMHEGVQCAAADALASLVKVFFESTPSAHREAVRAISSQSLQAMLSEIADAKGDVDAEVMVSLFDAMADILNVSAGDPSDPTTLLPEGFLTKAFDCINGILTILMKRRSMTSRSSLHHNDDDDDDDEEEDRDEADESIMYGILRLAAALFKCYKSGVLAASETLLQFCLQCISPQGHGKTSSHLSLRLFKHASLCVLDDLVHWVGVHTAPIHEYVSGCFFAALQDEDPDCRQAAAFGIGMCSEHAPSVYEQACLDALPILLSMIDHPDSQAPSVVTVTDNCMSAVGRICKAFPTRVDLAAVLPRWLKGLPVTHDEDEAPFVYSWLLELFSSHHAVFNLRNVTESTLILRGLVEALIRECLLDPLKSQVRSTLASVQSQAPAEVVQAILSSYTPGQLAKLQ